MCDIFAIVKGFANEHKVLAYGCRGGSCHECHAPRNVAFSLVDFNKF